MTTMRLHASAAGLASDEIRIVPSRDMESELPAMYRVRNAACEADGELESGTFEGMRAYYRTLVGFEPAKDLVIARIGERIGGYARAQALDSHEGDRWYEATCVVGPDVRRHGLGRRLLAWSERRRLAMAEADRLQGVALDRPRWLTTVSQDGDSGAAVVLELAGYERFRQFHAMRRPDLDRIPDLPLPDGLDIRPIPNAPDAVRSVIVADNEAFLDHFGSHDDVDGVYAMVIGDPDTDVSLWLVAYDGDEIAGGILNGIHADHDGTRVGWHDSIFTRRPWRRRGLARALIARSLRLLRERGVSSAALGVDAANPNQALHLYESCGFRVVSTSSAWRKPLPPADAPAPLPADVSHEEEPSWPPAKRPSPARRLRASCSARSTRPATTRAWST
jgi:mycothiol synthase